VTQEGTVEHARAYVEHQASKGLDSLAELIDRTATDWTRCLEAITDGGATFAPDTEWSVKDVLGHFIVSSHSVNRRIADLAKGSAFAGTFDSAWNTGMTEESERGRTISELRSRVGLLFQDISRLASELSETDNLSDTFEHPAFGDLDLKQWIAFQRIHSMDHIQQIDKIKSQSEYPSS
jgi:hypothetical protein